MQRRDDLASLEDVISQRFEALNTAIEHLEELKQEQISLSEFLQHWRIQSMVLHNLQIAIQAVIDISNTIIAEKGYSIPQNNRNIIEILSEYEIFPESFCEKISGMVGFRNIIVHEYTSINLQIVYHLWQERISDFREYAQYIASFVAEQI